jgi:hypothetical protein
MSQLLKAASNNMQKTSLHLKRGRRRLAPIKLTARGGVVIRFSARKASSSAF